MQRMTVTKDERGQRLDKYLKRRLPLAPASFLYRMLRKKNITLRGRKADGSEKVEEGDEVVLFLSDETIGKFSGAILPGGYSAQTAGQDAGRSAAGAALPRATSANTAGQDAGRNVIGAALPRATSANTAGQDAGRSAAGAVSPGAYSAQTVERDRREMEAFRRLDARLGASPVLYEDENILLVRKPAGVLSQKASTDDFSMNEWLRRRCSGSLLYQPSVCNRLDRNTGGILLCAKTLQGSRALSAVIRDRRIRKTYQMIVHGRIERPGRIEGILEKDHARNTVYATGVSVYKKAYVRGDKCARQQSAASRYVGSDAENLHLRGDRCAPQQSAASRHVDSDAENLHPGGEKQKKEPAGLSARRAATGYRPLRRGTLTTLVEADLLTGRSHQIRVHLQSIGHPILFDPKYGDREKDGTLSALVSGRASGGESMRRALPGNAVKGNHSGTSMKEMPCAKPGASGQLLWCTEVAFPKDCGMTDEDAVLAPVAGRTFSCPAPKWWEKWLV